MTEMKFDLEDARNELETVKDLLKIFLVFFVEECPSKNGDAINATVFAMRASHYRSLVSAACDKVIAMVEQMETAIENYYAEIRKEHTDEKEKFDND
ncbi:MAG: hypothetical protein ACI4JS_03300 [Oscillospiraceae bacterium]